MKRINSFNKLMENIPKSSFISYSDSNKDNKEIQNENNSIKKNNISEDKNEKENKESKQNNNEISNNINENNFMYKSKNNLLNFNTSYPLLFK